MLYNDKKLTTYPPRNEIAYVLCSNGSWIDESSAVLK